MTFDLMEIQFPHLVEQEICAKEIEIDEILDGKIGIHFTVNKIDQSNYSINGRLMQLLLWSAIIVLTS